MADISIAAILQKALQAALAAAISALATVIWAVGQGVRSDIAAIHADQAQHEAAQSRRETEVGERLGRLESTAKTNVERIDRLENRVDNAVARLK